MDWRDYYLNNEEFNILLISNKTQMKFLLITIITLSAFVIPAAFAESTPEILVQIIHRDSNGNLITYMQSEKMTYTNISGLNFLLDHESSLKQDPIYEIDGKKFQVITRQFVETFDSQTLLANTQLKVNMNNVEVTAAEFLHDGFRIDFGDTITTVWNFVRLV